jgi:hypothetical protein
LENQATLMEIMTENEWDIENYMAMSECSNCDQSGHILESCPKLFDEKKFTPQCLLCHKRDISTEQCCDIKN